MKKPVRMQKTGLRIGPRQKPMIGRYGARKRKPLHTVKLRPNPA